MRRTVATFLAVLIFLAVLPQAAFSQSDSGEISITVVDAATKTPIALARVLLDGAVIISEQTSSKGEVHFTDVPDGIYRARIVKRGYTSLTSNSFEVLDGRLVNVSFQLVADTGGLKVIGSVAVKASATISSTSITENSPQRRLSDDLAGALNKLSGVSVSTSDDSTDATQTISLEGHDASQTAMTLDGIPLNAPGAAGNLRGFATDLFSGASVHQGATIGGLGGSVNFSTLQPTLSYISQIAATVGSYGRYNFSLAETGSFGKLGMAVQTVYRQIPSLIDGMYYLDASGLAYQHDGDAETQGNLVKLRYQFSDSQTITASFLNSIRNTDVACLRNEGPPSLPCGVGPDNTNDGSVQLYSLTDNALMGATEIQASLYSSTTTNLLDEEDRLVNLVPDPTGFGGLQKSHGFTLNATLPAKEKHTLSIQAYANASQSESTPLVPEAIPYYTGSFNTSYEAVTLTDTIHSSDKLTLAESVGISAATGSGGPTALGSLNATWRPTTKDTYNASYSVGGVAASAGHSTILTDPASLRFNCNGTLSPSDDAAYGVAPGAEPGPSSSISYRVGYTHAIHGGSMSLQLYDQIQAGVLLPVLVNGSALPPNVYPEGYLQQVAGIYNSPAGCGQAPGTPFTTGQMYFNTPVGGVKRIYQGGELTGYASFGNLVVQPYYNVTVSKAISDSPYFSNPLSITISGNQLPNVPLQKAGVVFDYKAPRSIFEYLADAQYTAGNNPNNLPPYTTFDAGVTATLQRGTLTFAASNITNTYAGIFAGPAYAVPFQTLGGSTVPTVARPLTPRTFSVTYGVKFGQGVPSTQTGSAFNIPRGAGGGRGGGQGRGSDANGPPGGANSQGGGGFRNAFSPLPTAPPVNPLDVSTDTQRCGSDNAPQAQALSAELKDYVAKIEAAKTAAGYPATVPSPLLTDATVTYHGLGDTYALTIVPKGTNRMRALAGCFALHIARADDVTARKLFAPSSALFFVPQIIFTPSVGLYFVARQAAAGQEQFRVYALPSAPPKDPFQVRTATTCTGDAKNIAAQALGELRAYFSAPVIGSTKAPSFTITAHTATGGTWYELDPGDPSVIGAMLQCGRVATSTPDELAKRGFDGKPVPEMNYAAPLGLYFLRPARPPGQGRGGAPGQGAPPPQGGGPPPPP